VVLAQSYPFLLMLRAVKPILESSAAVQLPAWLLVAADPFRLAQH
jgi:hypothetical protein